MTCTMAQTITPPSCDNMVTKPSEARMESVYGSTGTSFDVGSFVLSGSRVQEPPSPNTVNAAVSCAINQALDLVIMDDASSYSSSCEDDPDDGEANDEGKTDHRKELLKDDMSLFYKELARLRVDSDDLSVCSSDEESEWDEEEEDDLCFVGLEDSSPDLFDSFKSRYGGVSE